MNPIAKFAIATAAVVVVAIVGFNLLSSPGTSQVGERPHRRRQRRRAARLRSHRRRSEHHRRRRAIDWSSPSVDVTFVLPDGWNGRED